MTGAIMIKWGQSVPGREAKGLEVFGKAVERFEGFAKQGRIHEHQEYFGLTGGENGFMLIRGEVEELLKILAEPESIKLNAQAAAIVNDFHIAVYQGGSDQSVQDSIGTYMGGLQELGYM
jgi:hypothetical protein